ncbi:GAD-like domain-containing protein [Paracoccus sp. ME4]|uniref:GAD-like domain-containing protein n=1 Tax=Paracoccus sp. ME4 TaxID=3138066 RepID=UPI00398A69E1
MKPIDEFRAEYGAPKVFVSPDSALDAIKGRGLPAVAFDYWSKFGFSRFLGGYFQITNLAKYTDVIEKWISGSHFSSVDSYFSITIDAFGRMQCLGVRCGHVFDLDPPNHAVYDREDSNEADIRNGNEGPFLEQMFFSGLPEDVAPETDDYYSKLSFSAKDKLGEFGPDQIYAPIPAISLGGQMRIEDLQIVDAPSYLTMVAEIAPPRVMTMKDLTHLAFGNGAEDILAGLLKK